tara:strand:- start:518 stop:640 length:123 start_codon:yes stop_codon:yes gene_type:complete
MTAYIATGFGPQQTLILAFFLSGLVTDHPATLVSIFLEIK